MQWLTDITKWWLGYPRRQWYCLHLSQAQLRSRKHEQLAARFQRIYKGAHRPRRMTLWLALVDGGGAVLYFSPQSMPLARDLLDNNACYTCTRPEWPRVRIAGHGYRAARGPHSPELDAIRPSASQYLPMPTGAHHTYR